MARSSVDHVQQESARRVGKPKFAQPVQGKLADFISVLWRCLPDRAFGARSGPRIAQRSKVGSAFINEYEGAGSDSDESVRSPLPEVTPREVPLHIAALEEADEGVPPENGVFGRSSQGTVAMRDYSYTSGYNGISVDTSFGAGTVGGIPPLAAPQKPGEAGDTL